MQAFVLIAALILAGCASQAGGAGSGADSGQPAESGSPPAEASAQVSAAELSTHSTAADCWVLYDGKVYDITSYLPSHPRPEDLIVPSCGKTDGSFKDAFEGEHGLSKVGMLKSEGILKGEYSG